MAFGYMYKFQQLDDMKLRYIAGASFFSFILDLPWLIIFGGVNILNTLVISLGGRTKDSVMVVPISLTWWSASSYSS